MRVIKLLRDWKKNPADEAGFFIGQLLLLGWL